MVSRIDRTTRVLIVCLERVHALDFAGPVQTLDEANQFGATYSLHYVGSAAAVRARQGFVISQLEPLPEPEPSDLVVVPGTDSRHLDDLEVPSEWLRQAVACGARVASVCSGAFALAKAGILDNRSCTTHWKVIDRLRSTCPSARVLENHLYVRDANVISSAGLASGIDMSLALVEDDHGPQVAAAVAREMVIYLRREGGSAQSSVYLDYRAHMHPAVHRVQDWIIAHPQERPTLERLADVAALSPRHLTRVFREATGTSILNFSRSVKLEVARQLLPRRELDIEEIARRCGFADGRQLRRLWKQAFGRSPRESRHQHPLYSQPEVK